MAHAYIEFGCYGVIGDFDTEGMTEKEIREEAALIFDDFIISEEYNVVILEDVEEY